MTTLSRREFLRVSSMVAAASLAAACAPAPGATTQPPAGEPPTAPAGQPTAPPEQPSRFREAPMLAERVARGELPPVEERLPTDPLIVTPTNMVGRYGGKLRTAGMAPETTSDGELIMVTGMFRFSNDLSVIYPEVAQNYQFDEDATSCTLQIRKGMRWSDGEPFTIDDVMFYFDDQAFNKDLSPSLSSIWRPGGEPMVYTRVDDHTIRFDFAVPNPAFALVQRSGAPPRCYWPRHFFEQYHIKYNPKADEEAKAAGFDNWQARFGKLDDVNYGAQDPSLPMLDPWIPYRNDSQGVYFTRNPYYFKVDTEGNQLPYIDEVDSEYTGNLEVMNMRAVSGELSVAGLDVLLANYPLLKQGEQQGDYTVHMVYSERGSDVALAFNQIHPDPVLHQIFTDVRFRRAMSLAINRDEINELIFLGQGTARQATINESASFFRQEWADAYVQYDLDQANQLLDELGLDQRDADGVRLRPDGQPLAFQLEYLPHEGPKKEVCELVVKHWAAVGAKVDAAGRERSFLLNRLNTNTHDASGWHVDRQLERAAYAYGSTQKLGPGGDSAITYGRAWRDWFNTGGASGSEPPQEAKDLYDAYAEWQQTTVGTPQYMEAAVRVHDMIAENLWVIGVIGQAPQPVLVKNNLDNIFSPDQGKFWWGAANWFWHTSQGCQWFFTS